MENNKPIFSENFICPECGTSDTVTLYSPEGEKPDFVLWCVEGHVVVRSFGKEKLVFDFEQTIF